MVVEYDGADFAGWQRQVNADRTVQGKIEAAFKQILQEPVTIVAAGRTDAGVHAEGQVAHMLLRKPRMPLDQLHRGVNSLLPDDVRILSLEEAPRDFHARYSATSRSYRYRVERRCHPLRRRLVWTPGFEWDDAVVEAGVALLEGRHSFKSFCLARLGVESPPSIERGVVSVGAMVESGYFCTVTEARWESDADGATFHISANRFLHKMVRGLMGALIDLGRGRYTLEEFQRLLDEPQRNGAVFVAPPQGLVLVRVEYPPSVKEPAQGAP